MCLVLSVDSVMHFGNKYRGNYNTLVHQLELTWHPLHDLVYCMDIDDRRFVCLNLQVNSNTFSLQIAHLTQIVTSNIWCHLIFVPVLPSY